MFMLLQVVNVLPTHLAGLIHRRSHEAAGGEQLNLRFADETISQK